MKIKTFSRGSLSRAVSLLVILSFLTSYHLEVPQAAAQEISPKVSLGELPGDLGAVRIPEEIGTIDETFRGNSGKTVILIQDAHAIPDAQDKIQKLLQHFEKTYRIPLVALEGAATEIDPELFKSFPDKETLTKVFRGYAERGELTGGNAAALFSERKTLYHGIEEWALYERGLLLYLQSMAKEPEISKWLETWKENLERRKAGVYSKELLQADRVVSEFYENYETLIEVLQKLAEFKAPRRGSELEALLRASRRGQHSDETLEKEVENLAREVQAFLKSKTAQSGFKEKFSEFNQKYQEFRTSRLPAEAFALFLKELAAREKISLRFSESLSRLTHEARRLREIEGTELYEELRQYIEEVRTSLIKTPDEKSLVEQSKTYRLFTRLAKLELSFDEWEGLNYRVSATSVSRHSEPASALMAEAKGTVPFADTQLLPLLSFHFRFYENAEVRDRVFLKKMTSLMERHKTNEALMVVGGFHTEGLIRRFRDEGISYLLIRPQIDSVPQESPYREQMRGNVSWKNYFRIERGKVNLYSAFARAARDQLLEEGSKGTVPFAARRYHRGPLLKAWRDEMIRDLAEQGRIEEAGDYTRFLDEAAWAGKGNGPQRNLLEEWFENIDRFIAGLGRLRSQGELNSSNVLQLLQTSKTPTTAAAIFGRHSVSPVLAGLKPLPSPSSARPRSEARAGAGPAEEGPKGVERWELEVQVNDKAEKSAAEDAVMDVLTNAGQKLRDSKAEYVVLRLIARTFEVEEALRTFNLEPLVSGIDIVAAMDKISLSEDDISVSQGAIVLNFKNGLPGWKDVKEIRLRPDSGQDYSDFAQGFSQGFKVLKGGQKLQRAALEHFLTLLKTYITNKRLKVYGIPFGLKDEKAKQEFVDATGLKGVSDKLVSEDAYRELERKFEEDRKAGEREEVILKIKGAITPELEQAKKDLSAFVARRLVAVRELTEGDKKELTEISAGIKALDAGSLAQISYQTGGALENLVATAKKLLSDEVRGILGRISGIVGKQVSLGVGEKARVELGWANEDGQRMFGIFLALSEKKGRQVDQETFKEALSKEGFLRLDIEEALGTLYKAPGQGDIQIDRELSGTVGNALKKKLLSERDKIRSPAQAVLIRRADPGETDKPTVQLIGSRLIFTLIDHSTQSEADQIDSLIPKIPEEILHSFMNGRTIMGIDSIVLRRNLDYLGNPIENSLKNKPDEESLHKGWTEELAPVLSGLPWGIGLFARRIQIDLPKEKTAGDGRDLFFLLNRDLFLRAAIYWDIGSDGPSHVLEILRHEVEQYLGRPLRTFFFRCPERMKSFANLNGAFVMLGSYQKILAATQRSTHVSLDEEKIKFLALGMQSAKQIAGGTPLESLTRTLVEVAVGKLKSKQPRDYKALFLTGAWIEERIHAKDFIFEHEMKGGEASVIRVPAVANFSVRLESPIVDYFFRSVFPPSLEPKAPSSDVPEGVLLNLGKLMTELGAAAARVKDSEDRIREFLILIAGVARDQKEGNEITIRHATSSSFLVEFLKILIRLYGKPEDVKNQLPNEFDKFLDSTLRLIRLLNFYSDAERELIISTKGDKVKTAKTILGLVRPGATIYPPQIKFTEQIHGMRNRQISELISQDPRFTQADGGFQKNASESGNTSGEVASGADVAFKRSEARTDSAHSRSEARAEKSKGSGGSDYLSRQVSGQLSYHLHVLQQEPNEALRIQAVGAVIDLFRNYSPVQLISAKDKSKVIHTLMGFIEDEKKESHFKAALLNSLWTIGLSVHKVKGVVLARLNPEASEEILVAGLHGLSFAAEIEGRDNPIYWIPSEADLLLKKLFRLLDHRSVKVVAITVWVLERLLRADMAAEESYGWVKKAMLEVDQFRWRDKLTKLRQKFKDGRVQQSVLDLLDLMNRKKLQDSSKDDPLEAAHDSIKFFKHMNNIFKQRPFRYHLTKNQMSQLDGQIKQRGTLPSKLLLQVFQGGNRLVSLFRRGGWGPEAFKEGFLEDLVWLADREAYRLTHLALPVPSSLQVLFEEFVRTGEESPVLKKRLMGLFGLDEVEGEEREAVLAEFHATMHQITSSGVKVVLYDSMPTLYGELARENRLENLKKILDENKVNRVLVLSVTETLLSKRHLTYEDGEPMLSDGPFLTERIPNIGFSALIVKDVRDWEVESIQKLHNLDEFLNQYPVRSNFSLLFGNTVLDEAPFDTEFKEGYGDAWDGIVFRSTSGDDDPDYFSVPGRSFPLGVVPAGSPAAPRSEVRAKRTKGYRTHARDGEQVKDVIQRVRETGRFVTERFHLKDLIIGGEKMDLDSLLSMGRSFREVKKGTMVQVNFWEVADPSEEIKSTLSEVFDPTSQDRFEESKYPRSHSAVISFRSSSKRPYKIEGAVMVKKEGPDFKTNSHLVFIRSDEEDLTPPEVEALKNLRSDYEILRVSRADGSIRRPLRLAEGAPAPRRFYKFAEWETDTGQLPYDLTQASGDPNSVFKVRPVKGRFPLPSGLSAGDQSSIKRLIEEFLAPGGHHPLQRVSASGWIRSKSYKAEHKVSGYRIQMTVWPPDDVKESDWHRVRIWIEKPKGEEPGYDQGEEFSEEERKFFEQFYLVIGDGFEVRDSHVSWGREGVQILHPGVGLGKAGALFDDGESSGAYGDEWSYLYEDTKVLQATWDIKSKSGELNIEDIKNPGQLLELHTLENISTHLRSEMRATPEATSKTREAGGSKRSIFLDPEEIRGISWKGGDAETENLIRQLIYTLNVSVPEVRSAAQQKLREFAATDTEGLSRIRRVAFRIADESLASWPRFLVERMVAKSEREEVSNKELARELATIEVEGKEIPLYLIHMGEPTEDENGRTISRQKSDELPGSRVTAHFTLNGAMIYSWEVKHKAVVVPLQDMIRANLGRLIGGLDGDFMFFASSEFPLVFPASTQVFKLDRVDPKRQTGIAKTARQKALDYVTEQVGKKHVFHISHVHEWLNAEAAHNALRDRLLSLGVHYGHHGSHWSMQHEYINEYFDALYEVLVERRTYVNEWLKGGGRPIEAEDLGHPVPWWVPDPTAKGHTLIRDRYFRRILRLFAENPSQTRDELWEKWIESLKSEVPEREREYFEKVVSHTREKRPGLLKKYAKKIQRYKEELKNEITQAFGVNLENLIIPFRSRLNPALEQELTKQIFRFGRFVLMNDHAAGNQWLGWRNYNKDVWELTEAELENLYSISKDALWTPEIDPDHIERSHAGAVSYKQLLRLLVRKIRSLGTESNAVDFVSLIREEKIERVRGWGDVDGFYHALVSTGVVTAAVNLVEFIFLDPATKQPREEETVDHLIETLSHFEGWWDNSSKKPLYRPRDIFSVSTVSKDYRPNWREEFLAEELKAGRLTPEDIPPEFRSEARSSFLIQMKGNIEALIQETRDSMPPGYMELGPKAEKDFYQGLLQRVGKRLETVSVTGFLWLLKQQTADEWKQAVYDNLIADTLEKRAAAAWNRRVSLLAVSGLVEVIRDKDLNHKDELIRTFRSASEGTISAIRGILRYHLPGKEIQDISRVGEELNSILKKGKLQRALTAAEALTGISMDHPEYALQGAANLLEALKRLVARGNYFSELLVHSLIRIAEKVERVQPLVAEGLVEVSRSPVKEGLEGWEKVEIIKIQKKLITSVGTLVNGGAFVHSEVVPKVLEGLKEIHEDSSRPMEIREQAMLVFLEIVIQRPQWSISVYDFLLRLVQRISGGQSPDGDVSTFVKSPYALSRLAVYSRDQKILQEVKNVNLKILKMTQEPQASDEKIIVLFPWAARGALLMLAKAPKTFEKQDVVAVNETLQSLVASDPGAVADGILTVALNYPDVLDRKMTGLLEKVLFRAVYGHGDPDIDIAALEAVEAILLSRRDLYGPLSDTLTRFWGTVYPGRNYGRGRDKQRVTSQLASILMANAHLRDTFLQSLVGDISQSLDATFLAKELVKRDPHTVSPELLIRHLRELKQETTAFEREILKNILEFQALKSPELFNEENLQELLDIYGAEPLKYLLFYLATRERAPPEPPLDKKVVSFAGEKVLQLEKEETFSLHQEVHDNLASGAKKALVIQNISDGIGDELIRITTLVEALLAYNPQLEITLVTRFPFLYSHPRVRTLNQDDVLTVYWSDDPKFERTPRVHQSDQLVEELVKNPHGTNYDIVVNYDDKEMNVYSEMAWPVGEYLSQQKKKGREPFLLIGQAKSDDNFVFNEVSVGGESYEEKRGFNKKRIENVYEPTFRLLAELGIPFRVGEELLPAQSLLVGQENKEAIQEWERLLAETGNRDKDSGKLRRPVYLLNPFGGESHFKGFYETSERFDFDRLRDLVSHLHEKGFLVVVMPNGKKWGSRAIAEQVISQLPEEVRRNVLVWNGRSQNPEIFKYLVSFAGRSGGRLGTVEGGGMHLAYALGVPYDLFLVEGSGSEKWQPMGASPNQRAVSLIGSAIGSHRHEVRRSEARAEASGAGGEPSEDFRQGTNDVLQSLKGTPDQKVWDNLWNLTLEHPDFVVKQVIEFVTKNGLDKNISTQINLYFQSMARKYPELTGRMLVGRLIHPIFENQIIPKAFEVIIGGEEGSDEHRGRVVREALIRPLIAAWDSLEKINQTGPYLITIARKYKGLAVDHLVYELNKKDFRVAKASELLKEIAIGGNVPPEFVLGKLAETLTGHDEKIKQNGLNIISGIVTDHPTGDFGAGPLERTIKQLEQFGRSGDADNIRQLETLVVLIKERNPGGLAASLDKLKNKDSRQEGFGGLRGKLSTIPGVVISGLLEFVDENDLDEDLMEAVTVFLEQTAEDYPMLADPLARKMIGNAHQEKFHSHEMIERVLRKVEERKDAIGVSEGRQEQLDHGDILGKIMHYLSAAWGRRGSDATDALRNFVLRHFEELAVHEPYQVTRGLTSRLSSPAPKTAELAKILLRTLGKNPQIDPEFLLKSLGTAIINDSNPEVKMRAFLILEEIVRNHLDKADFEGEELIGLDEQIGSSDDIREKLKPLLDLLLEKKPEGLYASVRSLEDPWKRPKALEKLAMLAGRYPIAVLAATLRSVDALSLEDARALYPSITKVLVEAAAASPEEVGRKLIGRLDNLRYQDAGNFQQGVLFSVIQRVKDEPSIDVITFSGMKQRMKNEALMQNAFIDPLIQGYLKEKSSSLYRDYLFYLASHNTGNVARRLVGRLHHGHLEKIKTLLVQIFLDDQMQQDKVIDFLFAAATGGDSEAVEAAVNILEAIAKDHSDSEVLRNRLKYFLSFSGNKGTLAKRLLQDMTPSSTKPPSGTVVTMPAGEPLDAGAVTRLVEMIKQDQGKREAALRAVLEALTQYDSNPVWNNETNLRKLVDALLHADEPAHSELVIAILLKAISLGRNHNTVVGALVGTGGTGVEPFAESLLKELLEKNPGRVLPPLVKAIRGNTKSLAFRVILPVLQTEEHFETLAGILETKLGEKPGKYAGPVEYLRKNMNPKFADRLRRLIPNTEILSLLENPLVAAVLSEAAKENLKEWARAGYDKAHAWIFRELGRLAKKPDENTRRVYADNILNAAFGGQLQTGLSKEVGAPGWGSNRLNVYTAGEFLNPLPDVTEKYVGMLVKFTDELAKHLSSSAGLLADSKTEKLSRFQHADYLEDNAYLAGAVLYLLAGALKSMNKTLQENTAHRMRKFQEEWKEIKTQLEKAAEVSSASREGSIVQKINFVLTEISRAVGEAGAELEAPPPPAGTQELPVPLPDYEPLILGLEAAARRISGEDAEKLKAAQAVLERITGEAIQKEIRELAQSGPVSSLLTEPVLERLRIWSGESYSEAHPWILRQLRRLHALNADEINKNFSGDRDVSGETPPVGWGPMHLNIYTVRDLLGNGAMGTAGKKVNAMTALTAAGQNIKKILGVIKSALQPGASVQLENLDLTAALSVFNAAFESDVEEIRNMALNVLEVAIEHMSNSAFLSVSAALSRDLVSLQAVEIARLAVEAGKGLTKIHAPQGPVRQLMQELAEKIISAYGAHNPRSEPRGATNVAVQRAEVRGDDAKTSLTSDLVRLADVVEIPVELVKQYVSEEEKQEHLKRGLLRESGGKLYAQVIRNPLAKRVVSGNLRSVAESLTPEEILNGRRAIVVKGVGLPIGGFEENWTEKFRGILSARGVPFAYWANAFLDSQQFMGGEQLQSAERSAEVAMAIHAAYQIALKERDPIVLVAKEKYGILEPPTLRPLYILKPLQIPVAEEGKIRFVPQKESLRKIEAPFKLIENQVVFVYEVPIFDRLDSTEKQGGGLEEAFVGKMLAAYGNPTDRLKIVEKFSAGLALLRHLLERRLNGSFTEVLGGYNNLTSLVKSNVTLSGHVVDLDTARWRPESTVPDEAWLVERIWASEHQNVIDKIIHNFAYKIYRIGGQEDSGFEMYDEAGRTAYFHVWLAGLSPPLAPETLKNLVFLFRFASDVASGVTSSGYSKPFNQWDYSDLAYFTADRITRYIRLDWDEARIHGQAYKELQDDVGHAKHLKNKFVTRTLLDKEIFKMFVKILVYERRLQRFNEKQLKIIEAAVTKFSRSEARAGKLVTVTKSGETAVAAALAPEGLRSELREFRIEPAAERILIRESLRMAKGGRNLGEVAEDLKRVAENVFSEIQSQKSQRGQSPESGDSPLWQSAENGVRSHWQKEISAEEVQLFRGAREALLQSLDEIRSKEATLGTYFNPKDSDDSSERALRKVLGGGIADLRIKQLIYNRDAPRKPVESLIRYLKAIPSPRDLTEEALVLQNGQPAVALIVTGLGVEVNFNGIYLPVMLTGEIDLENPLLRDYVELLKAVLALHLTDLIILNPSLLHDPVTLRGELLRRVGPNFSAVVQIAGRSALIHGSQIDKVFLEAEALRALARAA